MAYLYLLICLVVIVFSADWLVAGAVTIAKRFKISDFVIGAVIVGVGTSFPELVVSTIGAIEGNSDIAIGNVIGSNIFNVFGILSLTALIMPVAVSKENKRFDLPFCIGVSVLTLLLVFNLFMGGEAKIDRIDSAILLLCFALFLWNSLRGNKKEEVATDEVITNKQLAIGIGKVVIGLGALIMASRFFLDNAIKIAEAWGVNEAFIAITLVACGTSLPELVSSIIAVSKKKGQMALGNIVGSNIFNLLLILGVSSLVQPLSMGDITFVDWGVMVLSAVMLLVASLTFKKRVLDRTDAILLLLIYAAYMAWLVMG